MRNCENMFCDNVNLRPKLRDQKRHNDNKEITYLLNRVNWIRYGTEKL